MRKVAKVSHLAPQVLQISFEQASTSKELLSILDTSVHLLQNWLNIALQA